MVWVEVMIKARALTVCFAFIMVFEAMACLMRFGFFFTMEIEVIGRIC